MPGWNEVLQEINSPNGSYDSVRRKYLRNLSDYTKRNTIIYYSAYMQKPELYDDPAAQLSISDEDKNGFMACVHQMDTSKGLDLFLHTPGGNMSATDSIVRYLRLVFGNNIRAVIPHQAMSGGTIMALSCNKIVLGKGSSIGPIDPQFGPMALAGVLEEFEEIKQEIIANPSAALVWQHVLNKLQPGFINECRRVIEWSNDMATEFLETNMLKGQSADKIAGVVRALTEKSIVKSHSRQIGIQEAIDIFGSDNIVVLEEDQQLQDLVLSVHHAVVVMMQRTTSIKVIENQRNRAYLLSASPAAS